MIVIGRLLLMAIVSVVSLTFALIPEMAMYFLYGVIDPTTTMEKTMVIGLFLFFGTSLSVLFGFLGMGMWLAGMKAAS